MVAAICLARKSDATGNELESFNGMSVSLAGTYSVTLSYNLCSLPGDKGIVTFARAVEKVARFAGIDNLSPKVSYAPYTITYSW
jgi:hypothetical protein